MRKHQVLRFQGNHKWKIDTISGKYLRKYMPYSGSIVHCLQTYQELCRERGFRILIGILHMASLYSF